MIASAIEAATRNDKMFVQTIGTFVYIGIITESLKENIAFYEAVSSTY